MSTNTQFDSLAGLVLSSVAVLGSIYLQQTSKKSKLKLYYFDIPGKVGKRQICMLTSNNIEPIDPFLHKIQGEAIRLACAYGNIPLDDIRLTYEQFVKLKHQGLLAFGQVPALAVDNNTVLTQSASIMRYVGKMAGLYPLNDDIKAAFIDSIVDQEIDLFMGLTVSRYRGTLIFHTISNKFCVKFHSLLHFAFQIDLALVVWMKQLLLQFAKN